MNFGERLREKILVLVKAYPQPSTKYGETVCTAGLTEAGDWIRLYPINFRELPMDIRFAKWTWIEAEVVKATKDPRPESFHINHDSIIKLHKVGTGHQWEERRNILKGHNCSSLEDLELLHKKYKTSIGLITPGKIIDFIAEPVGAEWEPKRLEALKRATGPKLFKLKSTQSKKILEKVPYKFSYRFYCDNPDCSGHKLQVLDWEVSQSFRDWKKRYGSDTKALELMRRKYLTEFTSKHDLSFIMGTISSMDRFGIFSIIGLVYPPRREFEQMVLFDSED